MRRDEGDGTVLVSSPVRDAKSRPERPSDLNRTDKRPTHHVPARPPAARGRVDGGDAAIPREHRRQGGGGESDNKKERGGERTMARREKEEQQTVQQKQERKQQHAKAAEATRRREQHQLRTEVVEENIVSAPPNGGTHEGGLGRALPQRSTIPGDNEEDEEEIEYEEDFEEASEDEEYVPPRSSPEMMDENRCLPAPEISSAFVMQRGPSPTSEVGVNLKDLKDAMAEESRRAEESTAWKQESFRSAPSLASTGGVHNTQHGAGAGAEAGIAFPAFKFGPRGVSSLGPEEQRKYVKRLHDVRTLGVLERFEVSHRVLFYQRPQKTIEQFLNGVGQYRLLRSFGQQAFDEVNEEGVQTDPSVTDDAETQCPVYSLSSIGAEGANLLPFLRRVIPVLDACLGMTGGGGDLLSNAAEGASSFTEPVLGPVFQGIAQGQAEDEVKSISVIEQWCGADHIVVLFNNKATSRTHKGGEGKYDSVLGVYVVDAATLGQQHSPPSPSGNTIPSDRGETRPSVELRSFERITAMCTVPRRPLVVCGTKAGSLALYDLRQVTGAGQVTGRHELSLSFSTDVYVIKEDPTWPFIGEIESVCMGSDRKGDHVLFCLDVFGTLSFWRIIEKPVGGGSDAPGSLGGARTRNGRCGGHGMDLSLAFLSTWTKQDMGAISCIDDGVKVGVAPWQHNEFIVMTTGPHLYRGSRQANGTQVSPSRLDNVSSCGLPVDFAFNKFRTNVCAVVYSSGDIALYDTTACVALAYWAQCMPTNGTSKPSCAWSPLRPTIFFVAVEKSLQIWDFCDEKLCAPKVAIPLPSNACSLAVTPGGLPIIGMENGKITIALLPPVYLTPVQSFPPHFQHAPVEMEKEELLSHSPFIPMSVAVETDILQRALTVDCASTFLTDYIDRYEWDEQPVTGY